MAAIALIALVFAAIAQAAAGSPISRADRDQFDICYGSFEGAQMTLPQLESKFDPSYYREIGDAMEDLGANLIDLDMHFAGIGLPEDKTARERGHVTGRLPWMNPENRTLEFWARNGPMSEACFELIKRLNESLGP